MNTLIIWWKMVCSANKFNKNYPLYRNIMLFWPVLTSWFFNPHPIRGWLISFTPLPSKGPWFLWLPYSTVHPPQEIMMVSVQQEPMTHDSHILSKHSIGSLGRALTQGDTKRLIQWHYLSIHLIYLGWGSLIFYPNLMIFFLNSSFHHHFKNKCIWYVKCFAILFTCKYIYIMK